MFQHSVVSKYLQSLDKELLASKWNRFKEYFHNSEIQENIRNSKEEQFQEGFLRELFVKILGYTLNPEPNFNLTTEYKNIKDSKKADGAIIIDDSVKAVIELKGTDTTDLGKVETQAFGYKNNQPDCNYIVTSNFEKLRFYIDNAIEHIEFNLFTLNENDFELLYLCLAYENIEKDLPSKIKKESVSQEDAITKKLYNDYSLFKRELHQSLVTLNPQFDALTLFNKSQKLLDRFLFLFFAEDKQLLPPNSVRRVLEQWKQLKDLDEDIPLYSRFKKYFGYLNTGFKGKQYNVFAYNGGLFKPDEILDDISIDDNLLYKHTLNLSEYDFSSDVDVNILGHIFENSLNEIEEIQAELEGHPIDKSKTKRKKDGVFYTPKYITKYIVENTVGKLCEEKRKELDITDEAYQPAKQRSRKRLDNLQAFRDWLLQLTVCDPACGSGAFLNEALNYLIAEHRYIDELSAKYNKDALILSDVENSILENNLYGVDINEESVEIAKLSLWLRTAQPNRKLNDLSNNIKCGNSLIDDPEVAEEKVFNWQQEFPKIFEKGGFDVVIGNPPYVSRDMSDELKNHLKNSFKSAQYQLELYVAFIERSYSLLKKNSFFSFIVPNSWLKNLMMSDCRKFILSHFSIIELIPSLENVFIDASVDTMIFLFSKKIKTNKIDIKHVINQNFIHKHKVSQERFLQNDGYIFDVEVNDEIQPIVNKLRSNVIPVGEILDVIRGINPYDKYTGQSEEVIKSRAYHSDIKKDESFVPELKGLHLSRYNYNWDKKHFISYGDWLAAPRHPKYFIGERIIFREILGKTLVSTVITEEFKTDRSLYIAKYDKEYNDNFNVKYILGILNSKLMAFYFRYTNNEFDNLFPKIRVAEFKKLPIKNINKSNQITLSLKVEEMVKKVNEQVQLLDLFLELIQSKFDIEKISRNLNNWSQLDYRQLLKELKKMKVTLSLSEEAEWMQYFNEQKQKVIELQTQIEATDKVIDQMVYELYGLTEDEIEIVEHST